MSTSRFSQDARADAIGLEQDIILISGEELAELMIDHEVGVRTTASYSVKSIDHDAFRED